MVLMLHVKDLMRKNLAQKFQGYRMLGSLALAQVKNHFQIKEKPDYILEEAPLTGYLRYQTLFLKPREHHLKIEIFKQKKILIEKINQYFSHLGYQHTIVDIRIQ